MLMCGCWLVTVCAAHAQLPQPLPGPPAIPSPREQPFDGVITLQVDATDTAHALFKVHESIPVSASGSAVLLYPQWEPSSHAPSISAAQLAGLVVRAGQQRLEWRRDPLDPHAFHVQVPDHVDRLDLEFAYATRLSDGLLRPDLVNVQWQHMLLYPAGWFARDIPVRAGITLPSGLQVVSSLQVEGRSGNTYTLAQTTLERLTDAPLFGSRQLRTLDLSTPDSPGLHLDLVSRDPAALQVSDEQIAALHRLVAQTSAVFGRAPYRHFDAITILDDDASFGGIEHAESAEIYLPANYFSDPDAQLGLADMFGHEHVHAWNGRAHQPADLWTPMPNMPIRNSLLWVYEGQTEFWGRVLAARSGMRSRQQAIDNLALVAAEVAASDGRAWKTLRDTVNDPLYVTGASTVWPEWQRRKDYYGEGVLLWLDVEMTLRARSHGRYGLDDFARRFFAAPQPGSGPATYTFEDVCAALAALVPMDWAGYLNDRLDAHDAIVLQGLARGGWALVYEATPTAAFAQSERDLGGTDLRYSIGLVVADSGKLRSVAMDSPAYNAGLAPGAVLTSVNGATFSPAALRAAVANSARQPVSLGYTVDGKALQARLDYHQGARYPRLVRIPGSEDRLSALLAPRPAGG